MSKIQETYMSKNQYHGGQYRKKKECIEAWTLATTHSFAMLSMSMLLVLQGRASILADSQDR